MFRREMGSKRGSLPPKEGDLTCMPPLDGCPIVITLSVRQKTLMLAITSLPYEINLSYLACVILMTRPFRRYQTF